MPDRFHLLRLPQCVERRRELGSRLPLLRHVARAAIESIVLRHRHPGKPPVIAVGAPEPAFKVKHRLAVGDISKACAHFLHIIGMY